MPNRKKTFCFTKPETKSNSKYQGQANRYEVSQTAEDYSQNESKYSNGSNVLPLGIAQKVDEIRRLEPKYRLGSNAKYSNPHQTYVSGSTLSSSAVRTGLIVVGGTNLRPGMVDSRMQNTLQSVQRRGKTTNNRKPSLGNTKLKPHADPNMSISDMINPSGVFC